QGRAAAFGFWRGKTKCGPPATPRLRNLGQWSGSNHLQSSAGLPRGGNMKQAFFAILSLLLCANATAKDKKDQTAIPPNACLAVYPGGDPCVANWGIHAGRVTPNCFTYLESANFPMKEIKTY